MNWDLRASLLGMKTGNLRVHSDWRIVSASGSDRERRESDVPLLQKTWSSTRVSVYEWTAADGSVPPCSWDPAPYVHLARDMCLPGLCREGDLDGCSATYREELNDAVSSNQGSQAGRCMRGSRHRSRWTCVTNCELMVWVRATASGWVAENREVKLFPSSCSCGHMYLLAVAM